MGRFQTCIALDLYITVMTFIYMSVNWFREMVLWDDCMPFHAHSIESRKKPVSCAQVSFVKCFPREKQARADSCCTMDGQVTSRKDQEQYWAEKSEPYQYVSVTAFSRAFKDFHVGVKLQEELKIPFDKSKSHKAALTVQPWALSQYDYLKISFDKEVLFLKRNSAIYIFKTVQVHPVRVSKVYVQSVRQLA